MTDQIPSGSSTGNRRLGFATGALIVVANMIGTGVFTTTGFLIRDLTASNVVLCWLIGGVVALCGALCYSELVAALPRNGGEYQILSRVFHPAIGFIAGWISLVVGFSAPTAASAIAFGKYLTATLSSSAATPEVYAVVLVVALSAIHAVHVRVGGALQNVFTIAKVILILVFIAGGVTRTDWSLLFAAESGQSAGVLSPAFAISLIYVSFSYSGWNASAYLAGEIKDPTRALPRTLMAGTALVMLLYLGLNLIFVTAAPRADLAGVVEVGHIAAQRLFGDRAGAMLTRFIALALVSSVSAMVMAGPRVYHAVGEDYRPLAFLARRSRLGGPAAAVALQCALTVAMLLTSTFEKLLTYIGFTLSISSGLTVFGVLWFRRREPTVARPYLAWGYPVTPLVYIAICGWIVVHTLVQRPDVAIAGVATIGSGALLFLAVRRSRVDAPADSES